MLQVILMKHRAGEGLAREKLLHSFYGFMDFGQFCKI